MAKRFIDRNNVYSVDMMFAYVNNFKCEVVSLPIEIVLHNLEISGWYEKDIGEIAPRQVIDNPKKYKNQFEKVKNADLKYPIMLWDLDIVDGAHRLSKAVIEGKKTIKAYQFSSNLMKKFKIPGTNLNKINEMQPFEFIDLFVKRFY